MNNLLNSLLNWYRSASRKQKIKIGLLGIGIVACLALALASGNPQAGNASPDSSPLYFLGVIARLAGVLLLIVGGGVLAMRWARNPRRHNRSGQMMLVESVRLSPKQALHLVQVGGQQFLVGATDQSIALISAVDSLPDEQLENTTPIAADFNHLLRGLVNVRLR
ncbi:MAG: flagellar biosynthetic protein FliO [Bellilinea sp.]|jgi:flagellar biosynthetic protein FliO